MADHLLYTPFLIGLQLFDGSLRLFLHALGILSAYRLLLTVSGHRAGRLRARGWRALGIAQQADFHQHGVSGLENRRFKRFVQPILLQLRFVQPILLRIRLQTASLLQLHLLQQH